MDAFRFEPLSEATLPDLLRFFERRAFEDHPEWRSCYCHFPHADHARIVWKERTGEQNRAATCERVAAGTMGGWLAYDDAGVAGWCNAGARAWIAGLFDEPEPLEARIGAIACFAVAPERRGQGLARALLQHACEGLAAQGFEWAEAYPRADAATAAAAHHGPLALFEAAGFAIVKRDDDGGLVVRKPLT